METPNNILITIEVDGNGRKIELSKSVIKNLVASLNDQQYEDVPSWFVKVIGDQLRPIVAAYQLDPEVQEAQARLAKAQQDLDAATLRAAQVLEKSGL